MIDAQHFKVTLLSIPNIWLNFYIYGFFEHPGVNLELKPQNRYYNFNFSNKVVVLVEYIGKNHTIVIDTDDPNEKHFNYVGFDYVFLSQKLKDSKLQYPDNVFALNPHFPFRHNVLNKLLFYNFIWFKFPIECFRYYWQNLRLKQFKSILNLRNVVTGNTIFHYRTLWKKELHTNLFGALFLHHFEQKGYQVVGGLVRRKDNFRTNNPVIDRYVVNKRLTNEKYLYYFSKSMYVLNTPAVRGALSWRFAEYLFANKKIITTPIKVEVPSRFNYFLIEDDSVGGFLQSLGQIDDYDGTFDNSDLVNKVLFPKEQIDFILQKIT